MAVAFYAHTISLPLNPAMRDADAGKVIEYPQALGKSLTIDSIVIMLLKL